MKQSIGIVLACVVMLLVWGCDDASITSFSAPDEDGSEQADGDFDEIAESADDEDEESSDGDEPDGDQDEELDEEIDSDAELDVAEEDEEEIAPVFPISVVTGNNHACALMEDETVRCWGSGSKGQLGNGAFDDHTAPVQVSDLVGVTSISSGFDHTCAIMHDGSVKCWGYNNLGQLGDGTSGTDRNMPVSVVGLDTPAVEVTTGLMFTCVLTNSGSARCWGNNSSQQLGDGTGTNSLTPVEPVGLDTGVIQISSGRNHSCALLNTGELRCWGWNWVLGGLENVATPTIISDLESGVETVDSSDVHVCAIVAGGGLKCWGRNESGQLGDGNSGDHRYRHTPQYVSGLTTGVRSVALGARHTCAVLDSGQMKCFGNNWDGQLGIGTSGTGYWSMAPQSVLGLSVEIEDLSLGAAFGCVLTDDQDILCWGDDSYGQLGMETSGAFTSPVQVSVLGQGVQELSLGNRHSCALDSLGQVRCWGSNGSGQLGDGTQQTHLTPVMVSGLGTGHKSIAAGVAHSCAVTEAGAAMCWGNNFYGQLGDGSKTDRPMPVGVSGLTSGVKGVGAGRNHSCAVTILGAAKCWGVNISRQLGDGSNTDSSVPVDVVGLDEGVNDIDAGWQFSCALTSAGAVLCWGANDAGQLGNGDAGTSQYEPVAVFGLDSGVQILSVGDYHACAITSDGGAVCWGSNSLGRLGNGSTVSSDIPVSVTGLSSGVVSIDAGYTHSCAVISSGAVKCWGSNTAGELGDGSRDTYSSTPRAVIGVDNAVGVAIGVEHTCAILDNGSVVCWGDSGDGQIGNGYGVNQTSPALPVSF